MNFIGTLQKSRFWRVKVGFRVLGLEMMSPIAVWTPFQIRSLWLPLPENTQTKAPNPKQGTAKPSKTLTLPNPRGSCRG